MRGESVVDVTALELNFFCVDPYGFPSLRIARVYSFSVDLFCGGTPNECSALQKNISGESIRFMPVNHIQNHRFAGIAQYGGDIEIRNVRKHPIAVFLTVGVYIQSGTASIIRIQIERLVQTVL